MYWAHTLAHVNLKFRCRKNWCKIIQYDACFEPEPSYPDQNQENDAICVICLNFAHEKYVLVNIERPVQRFPLKQTKKKQNGTSMKLKSILPVLYFPSTENFHAFFCTWKKMCIFWLPTAQQFLTTRIALTPSFRPSFHIKHSTSEREFSHTDLISNVVY